MAGYAICYCERDMHVPPHPHIHVPKTDHNGVPVGALWDEPEPPEDPIERRLRACEANLQNVWEVLNARDADHR